MANQPVHVQLMNPARDPQEFISSSIYWYPLLYPTRTEVLDHLMLCNGNGYAWGADGNICSVYSHMKPDCDLDLHEDEIARYTAKAVATDSKHLRELYLEWVDDYRLKGEQLLDIRENHAHLARTYGPIRESEQDLGSPSGHKPRTISTQDLSWTLLGQALKLPNEYVRQICGPPPERIAPAWQRIVDETLLLFAPILIEQGRLWEE